MKKLLLAAALLLSSNAQAEYVYADFWDLFLEVRKDVRVGEISCDELNEKVALLAEIHEDLPEWRQIHTERIFESQIARKENFRTCSPLFDFFYD